MRCAFTGRSGSRRAEALDRGHGTAAAVGNTGPPRATSLERQHRTDEHREHAPADSLVAGERVAQPVRRCEPPLPGRQAILTNLESVAK